MTSLFAMVVMFSLIQLPVRAEESVTSNEVKLIDILDDKVTTVKAGTVITWTTDEIKNHGNLENNATYAEFDLIVAGETNRVYSGGDLLRKLNTTSAGSYTVPSAYITEEEVTKVIGNVDTWNVVNNGNSFRLRADGYKVEFDSNTGSGSMENVYFTNKEAVDITLPSYTFTAPDGKEFDQWAIGSTTGTKVDAGSSQSFSANTTVYAIWKDLAVAKYDVTVNGGSGSEKYAEGDTVTITANAPDTGKQFKEWMVVSGGITLASSTSATTTFTMPAGNVEVTAEFENIPNPTNPIKPEITTGAGSTHQISNGKDMTLTCSGMLEDLIGIYVDGKVIDASNYTLSSGSTILTLKANYLDTLATGSHALKFQYKGNLFASTIFMIVDKAETVNPEKPEETIKPDVTVKPDETVKPNESVKPDAGKKDTAVKDTASSEPEDTSSMMLYFSVVLLSGCVALYTIRRKKIVNK